MTDSREYPQTPANSVQRLRKRAAYDYETVHSIINSCSVLHVSFNPSTEPNPTPAILPMIGQVGVYPGSGDDTPACYLHGWVSSRLMRLAATAVDTGQPGLPICVAATHVDGYVLALTPFHHSYNWRSAVLHGSATVVEDDAERMWAMELVTNGVVPERWQNSRAPPDKVEMQSTRILKVQIETASAKVRGEVPGDERKDLKKDEVMDAVWAGVVPVYERYAEPVAAPYNRVKEVPDHITRYVREENAKREKYATEVAGRVGKKKSEE